MQGHSSKTEINLARCFSRAPPRDGRLFRAQWTPVPRQEPCPQRLPLVAFGATHPVQCLRAEEVGLQTLAAPPTGEDQETLIRRCSFTGWAQRRRGAIVHRTRIALESVAERADKRVSRLLPLPFRRKTSEPEGCQPILEPGQRGMFLWRFGDTFARCHFCPPP